MVMPFSAKATSKSSRREVIPTSFRMVGLSSTRGMARMGDPAYNSPSDSLK